MKAKLLPVLFILIFFYWQKGAAQVQPDTTRLVRIETSDGNTYVGSVISEDQNVIFIKTDRLGTIKVPREDIKSMTDLKNTRKVAGRLWLPNPQSARYFWAPNGYGLEGGKSYYQNIWVLYNQFSFGITNNVSLGGGLLPLFLFDNGPTPAWIVPKFSIPVFRDKLNIGAGALLGTVFGENDISFGLLYETTTFGTRDYNLSVGFAYGFASGNWMSRPLINISGMIRTGPRGYFITENYLIPFKYESGYDMHTGRSIEKRSTAVVISLGGRTIVRNVGLDYSLWIPINADMDSFIAIPFLGVTYTFGNNKSSK